MNRQQRRASNKKNRAYFTKEQMTALKKAKASALITLDPKTGEVKQQIIFTSNPLDEKLFGPVIHTIKQSDLKGELLCDICNKVITKDNITLEPCSTLDTYMLCEECSKPHKKVDSRYPVGHDLSKEAWFS